MKKEVNLEAMRHTLAHIMMQALEKLYGATPAVGPAIENGFYHDFEAEHQVTEADLKKIRKEMIKIINKDLPLEKKVMPIDEGIKFLEDKKYRHTAEMAQDLKAEEKEISFYEQGDFINMCSGPHIKSTGLIDPKSFKLTRLAGAYWKGDEKNEMLQRIYGIAFHSPAELKEYEEMMEEAKKRDHRKLGKELDLFVFSPTVGKGLPLWTSKGATLRRVIENYIVEKETDWGYEHVRTPDIASIELYKKSGHYPYYKESMYAPIDIDGDEFMLRPMACPHHFELYLSQPHSYKDLPMRIAELAGLYRYEQSGELSGLIRVRNFCLADAHIICADEKQAGEEVGGALDLIDEIADDFGLTLGENYWYRLSLGNRDNTKKYFDAPKKWDEAEKILRKVLKKRKAPFVEAEDEAAFYGPKVDVQMRNINGKEDTAFTVQYDFAMPGRFDLEYTDKKGEKQEPIVIHRSSVGAIERIIAFLIEHYAGAFPFWLSPVQAKILPVAEEHNKYAENIFKELKEAGFRVELDDSNNSFGKKVREAKKAKLPYFIIVGEKDIKDKKLTLESREGESEQISLEELTTKFNSLDKK